MENEEKQRDGDGEEYQQDAFFESNAAEELSKGGVTMADLQGNSAADLNPGSRRLQKKDQLGASNGSQRLYRKDKTAEEKLASLASVAAAEIVILLGRY